MHKFDISILGSGWLGLPLIRFFHDTYGLQVAASTRQLHRFPELESAGALPFRLDVTAPAKHELTAFLNGPILIINITCKDVAAFAQLAKHIAESPVSTVLLISSSSVYRNLNRVVTEDEGAENPDNALFQIEQCFRAESGFKTTILRCSGLVDQRRHPGRFFQHGKAVPQADAPTNLIHLDDVIGMIDCIIQQQFWGDVFNACSDTHPTKKIFYSFASACLNLPPPNFDDQTIPAWKQVSNDKIKHQLGYRLIHPDLLKSGLNDD
ncbi:Protein yeeZ precursor [Methylophaga frappieri]|uniref:Protein yeeZ n=1 Tax=Methylophaga frappieri (strain ATCC BAA-2434 / DSM 25690 / JAM7) TaxID=754477 RepID=I1YKY7_METFJ|nr:nucleoside-diphosphate sugar epimerase [Methylophaga frappieri]AFJ03580.1 Protein yeeZ precursor [Methylophaga frappieri]